VLFFFLAVPWITQKCITALMLAFLGDGREGPIGVL
jgi:hypothetical protein